MTTEMTKGLDLESIEDAYPVGCHACGDTVETCDGLYYDHGACDASGKPVPEGVERRAPSTVKALVAEVRRLREERQGICEDVVYVGASCDREITIDGVDLRAARLSPTRFDVERIERERDEAIALERERCAGLVREIPACQPGAKATPARRWLDDRIAACVRAILSDDETATCARSLVREARERAKAAEADADRLRTDNGRLDDVAKGALDDLAMARAELDATRAAVRAFAPQCSQCEALATRRLDGYGDGEAARCDGCSPSPMEHSWSHDLPHAAAIRAAGGVR